MIIAELLPAVASGEPEHVEQHACSKVPNRSAATILELPVAQVAPPTYRQYLSLVQHSRAVNTGELACPTSREKYLRDRYHVERLLGRGGMADVYLAFDTQRQTYIAIKLIREDLADDADFIRRFSRKTAALAAPRSSQRRALLHGGTGWGAQFHRDGLRVRRTPFRDGSPRQAGRCRCQR